MKYSKFLPMNDLHENELSFLVDSLTPHQRVCLQRLVGEFLTSFPEADQEVHPEWLALHRESAQNLFTLLELLRKFENEDSDSDIRPYALSVPEPGHACLKISRRFIHWRGLWDPKTHAWVKEVQFGRLSVDLAAVEEITSSAIAWLVVLASHVPERRIHLLGASPLIRRSLAALHLGDVLVVHDPQ